MKHDNSPLNKNRVVAMPITVSADEYSDAAECNTGWCCNCKNFTNDCVEPDAQGYKCHTCGYLAVMGAENALLQGIITIE